jgi:two-component sensor histidine kinase
MPMSRRFFVPSEEQVCSPPQRQPRFGRSGFGLAPQGGPPQGGPPRGAAKGTAKGTERAAADGPAPSTELRYYRLDREFRFVAANDAALLAWGRTRTELIGRKLLDVMPEAHDSAVWQAHLAVARSGAPARVETVSPVLHRWVEAALHPEPEGGVSVSFHETSDRRRREAAATEIRHRLANDLQFVLSQVELARMRLEGHATAALLDRAIERAAFSSRLQRRLLGPPEEKLAVCPILTDVVQQTLGGFPGVRLDLDLAPAALPRWRVTPLVLLVWEAATNAAKHVFRPGIGTRFTLVLAPAGTVGAWQLTIGDDGPGLPENPADRGGIGRDLMRELAEQLGATLDVAPGPGAGLHVRFSTGATEPPAA